MKAGARDYAYANCGGIPGFEAAYQAVLCGKLEALVMNIHNEVETIIGNGA